MLDVEGRVISNHPKGHCPAVSGTPLLCYVLMCAHRVSPHVTNLVTNPISHTIATVVFTQTLCDGEKRVGTLMLYAKVNTLSLVCILRCHTSVSAKCTLDQMIHYEL